MPTTTKGRSTANTDTNDSHDTFGIIKIYAAKDLFGEDLRSLSVDAKHKQIVIAKSRDGQSKGEVRLSSSDHFAACDTCEMDGISNLIFQAECRKRGPKSDVSKVGDVVIGFASSDEQKRFMNTMREGLKEASLCWQPRRWFEKHLIMDFWQWDFPDTRETSAPIPETSQSSDRVHKFKIFVGPKRKAFSLSTRRFAGQSQYLSRKAVSVIENRGVPEIYLPELNPDDFDIFSRWLYRKGLPQNLFSQDVIVTEIADRNDVDQNITWNFSRMERLYLFADLLEAKHFKNTLMDTFFEVMRPLRIQDFNTIILEEDIRHTMLYKAYLHRVVKMLRDMNTTDKKYYEMYNAYAEANETRSTDHTELYHDIFMQTLENLSRPTEKLPWQGYAFHEHNSAEEICYVKECNEARRRHASLGPYPFSISLI